MLSEEESSQNGDWRTCRGRLTTERKNWGHYRLYEAVNSFLGARLYHLRDRASAQYIVEHVLLSRPEAEARRVCPALPGGNGLTRYLDERRGLLMTSF